MGCKPIDHKDNDGLNNQRRNLRKVTNQQNIMNAQGRLNSLYSKYKGVSYNKRAKLWIAQIKFNNKNIGLGYFKTELGAVKAYNKGAKKYFKNYAYINKI